MSLADWSNTIYGFFFVTVAIFAGAGYMLKHYVQRQTEEIKEDLNRIMYALYNEGHTGLVNKVDQLIERQQEIKIDVEVMKARYEQG